MISDVIVGRSSAPEIKNSVRAPDMDTTGRSYSDVVEEKRKTDFSTTESSTKNKDEAHVESREKHGAYGDQEAAPIEGDNAKQARLSTQGQDTQKTERKDSGLNHADTGSESSNAKNVNTASAIEKAGVSASGLAVSIPSNVNQALTGRTASTKAVNTQFVKEAQVTNLVATSNGVNAQSQGLAPRGTSITEGVVLPSISGSTLALGTSNVPTTALQPNLSLLQTQQLAEGGVIKPSANGATSLGHVNNGAGGLTSFTGAQLTSALGEIASTGVVKSQTLGSVAPKGSIFAQDLAKTMAAGLVPTDAKVSDMVDIHTQLLAQTNAKVTQSSVSQWGPVSVNPQGTVPQQAQALMTPLRDQLRFQIDQQIKQAEIRLDPPELGKLDLNIRLDGDRLHIQLHAANPAIRDALLSGLERLRADLSQDHGGMVDVDISQGDSSPSQQESGRSQIAVNNGDSVDVSNEHSAQETNQLNILA